MTAERHPGFVPISASNQLQPAPKGWSWKLLTKIARLESGHTPSRYRNDWWGGDISWLSLTEIREFDGQHVRETQIKTNADGIANSAARVLPRGTVCLSRTASVGFVAIMENPMATSQDFANWICGDELDPEYLMYSLIYSRSYVRSLASGATHKTIYMPTLEAFKVCLPDRQVQAKIVANLKLRLMEAYRANHAAVEQLDNVSRLADSIIVHSLCDERRSMHNLADVLLEVKQGIGGNWKEYPVLGATRDGLAPAKEPPGKHAVKYKPAFPGTVFYNPMRILIGSIAFVDENDESGITSPDYVVLRGREGAVDSRWFYYWLRSPLGVQCINTLARGAVRERMLFNRLAEGTIELPSYTAQQKASLALKELKPLRAAVQRNLEEINLLSGKILAQAFKD